jgi:hypothetical protein
MVLKLPANISPFSEADLTHVTILVRLVQESISLLELVSAA